MEKGYKRLTPEEEYVIMQKGTERPFSGKYLDFDQEGAYMCKRCGAPLFRSEDKFDASCGWPSFDDEILGAIRRVPDPDGARTEIQCMNCGAHLGHVFYGEGLTPKDVRHCVNSISLDFRAKEYDNEQKAYFSAGCFWGVEYCLRDTAGIISTRVGFMGGKTSDPTYEEVSLGDTGHAETVEVLFDSRRISYESLVKLFYEIHDPTEKDRQGPDVGSQYRSAIFYTDEGQKKTAEIVSALLREKGMEPATEIAPAGEFYAADDYHQRYYEKTHMEPYCHIRKKIF